jgi:hypothetical protein
MKVPVVLLDVLQPGLEAGHEQHVLVDPVGVDDDLTAAREQEGDRARLCEVAARPCEGVAHVGGRAVAVVGQAVDEHGHSAGRVALVERLLIGRRALELAGTSLAGTLDVSLGTSRPWPSGRPAPATGSLRIRRAGLPGRRLDRSDVLGELLAALLVLAALRCLMLAHLL